MSTENTRKKHLSELEEKEQEVEDMRAASQKRIRSLEQQAEEEYAEKQTILRDKRQLEAKLSQMVDMVPAGNAGQWERRE